MSEINIIKFQDSYYPSLLKEISSPPPTLYIRGNKQLLSFQNLLAVVGSRKANQYAKICADRILAPVVEAGVSLVSGLAYGVDTIAHKVCLENKQPTIAVLGTGVDDESLYPRTSVQMAHQIINQGGTLISEYEPGTKPLKHHFPARNRIIAGLCKVSLIVQAAQKSGSLITARLALDANRDVCAIPGNINDPLAEGTNTLIKQGASPITCSDDLLHLFNIDTSIQKKPAANLSSKHLNILDLITDTPQHIDTISEVSDMSPQELSAQLLELELEGSIKNVGGLKYVRK